MFLLILIKLLLIAFGVCFVLCNWFIGFVWRIRLLVVCSLHLVIVAYLVWIILWYTWVMLLLGS